MRQILRKSLTIYIYIYILDCRKSWIFSDFPYIFFFVGGNINALYHRHRTGKNHCTRHFFNQIDKMNAVLIANGAEDKKIDYVKYINDAIEKAKKHAPVRKADVKSLKR